MVDVAPTIGISNGRSNRRNTSVLAHALRLVARLVHTTPEDIKYAVVGALEIRRAKSERGQALCCELEGEELLMRSGENSISLLSAKQRLTTFIDTSTTVGKPAPPSEKHRGYREVIGPMELSSMPPAAVSPLEVDSADVLHATQQPPHVNDRIVFTSTANSMSGSLMVRSPSHTAKMIPPVVPTTPHMANTAPNVRPVISIFHQPQNHVTQDVDVAHVPWGQVGNVALKLHQNRLASHQSTAPSPIPWPQNHTPQKTSSNARPSTDIAHRQQRPASHPKPARLPIQQVRPQLPFYIPSEQNVEILYNHDSGPDGKGLFMFSRSGIFYHLARRMVMEKRKENGWHVSQALRANLSGIQSLKQYAETYQYIYQGWAAEYFHSTPFQEEFYGHYCKDKDGNSLPAGHLPQELLFRMKLAQEVLFQTGCVELAIEKLEYGLPEEWPTHREQAEGRWLAAFKDSRLIPDDARPQVKVPKGTSFNPRALGSKGLPTWHYETPPPPQSSNCPSNPANSALRIPTAVALAFWRQREMQNTEFLKGGLMRTPRFVPIAPGQTTYKDGLQEDQYAAIFDSCIDYPDSSALSPEKYTHLEGGEGAGMTIDSGSDSTAAPPSSHEQNQDVEEAPSGHVNSTGAIPPSLEKRKHTEINEDTDEILGVRDNSTVDSPLTHNDCKLAEGNENIGEIYDRLGESTMIPPGSRENHKPAETDDATKDAISELLNLTNASLSAHRKRTHTESNGDTEALNNDGSSSEPSAPSQKKRKITPVTEL